MKDIDLDFERASRIGIPEIVYGEHKSAEQIREVARQYALRDANLLITRCRQEQVEGLEGEYDPISRTFIQLRQNPVPLAGKVGVVFAGTSDAPVAGEALVTLRYLGCPAEEYGDCGVAGLHRLMGHQLALRECDVLICCAGFEGALASVLASIMPQPVVAVPTSVGYGVSAGGHAAFNAMLASCASGLLVVNIDNGCGAAMAARRILSSLKSGR